MTKEIRSALENLEFWDADDSMDVNYVKSSPLYEFVDAVQSYDREMLNFLLYNNCLRVIPSWEFNCKDQQLRPQLFALRKYMVKKQTKEELAKHAVEIRSTKIDCTYSDTAGAAGALYNTIRSVQEDSALFATYALSDVVLANTGSPDEFDKWFVEIAVPVSFEKKFLNLDQTRKDAYEDYGVNYVDLFMDLQWEINNDGL